MAKIIIRMYKTIFHVRKLTILLILSFSLILAVVCFSCTTVVVEEDDEKGPVIDTVQIPATPDGKTEIDTEKEIPAHEEEPETVAKEEKIEEYQMDDEEYAETMEDLTGLIEMLNTIISNRNYNTWLSYLTKDYIDHFSDSEVLYEQSQMPILRNRDIVLRNLRDYFNYVVVASRQAVRLDDIKAIDENRVRAYMHINEQPVIIYTLEKTENNWKVGR